MGKKFYSLKYKMSKKLLWSIFFIFFIYPVSNGALAERQKFTTWGVRTCVKWLNGENDNGSDKDRIGLARLADQSWMSGYMTGINQMTAGDRDLLVELDLDTVIDWTDKFCQENTGANVTDAIAALFKKLKQRP